MHSKYFEVDSDDAASNAWSRQHWQRWRSSTSAAMPFTMWVLLCCADPGAMLASCWARFKIQCTPDHVRRSHAGLIFANAASMVPIGALLLHPARQQKTVCQQLHCW